MPPPPAPPRLVYPSLFLKGGGGANLCLQALEGGTCAFFPGFGFHHSKQLDALDATDIGETDPDLAPHYLDEKDVYYPEGDILISHMVAKVASQA